MPPFPSLFSVMTTWLRRRDWFPRLPGTTAPAFPSLSDSWRAYPVEPARRKGRCAPYAVTPLAAGGTAVVVGSQVRWEGRLRTRDLVTAADLLGHSSLTTTRRYAKASVEELEDAVEALYDA